MKESSEIRQKKKEGRHMEYKWEIEERGLRNRRIKEDRRKRAEIYIEEKKGRCKKEG